MNLAVTGSIASGKSTFARALASAHPFTYFDADACVRELLASNRIVQSELRNVFGQDVTAPDGGVDRARLRDKAFASEESRKKLEGILHPIVREKWLRLREDCAATGSDFLAEIPLLFEVSAEIHFDASILVAASPSVQRHRLTERGLPPEAVSAILSRQLPVIDKVMRSNVVVWNDGSQSQLEAQAALVVQRFNLPSP